MALYKAGRVTTSIELIKLNPMTQQADKQPEKTIEQDKEYAIGDKVPYLNTASKMVWAEITAFKAIERNNKLWFYGIDTKTRAHVFYPVHLSKNYLSAMEEYGRSSGLERERELSKVLSDAREENEKVKRLLHDLTPGGSEFYNDPKYCAEWIGENRREHHYALSEKIKQLQSQLTAKEAELNELMNFARSIREWELPETGKFWDEEKTRPTSYETEYGSNGVREFFRNKAAKIIHKIIAKPILNSDKEVQASVARDGDSSTSAGNQILIHSLKRSDGKIIAIGDDEYKQGEVKEMRLRDNEVFAITEKGRFNINELEEIIEPAKEP